MKRYLFLQYIFVLTAHTNTQQSVERASQKELVRLAERLHSGVQFNAERIHIGKAFQSNTETRLTQILSKECISDHLRLSRLSDPSRESVGEDNLRSDYGKNKGITFGRRRLFSYDDNDINIPNITTKTPTHSSNFTINFEVLCSSADFCSLNTEKTNAGDDVSCCKFCYCDANCEQRGDCCLTNRTVIGDSWNKHVCTTATVDKNPDKVMKRPTKEYHMIDACLYDNLHTCTDKKVAPWGALFPVYSSNTDTIYLNRYCALCNNEDDFQEWQVYMTCIGDQPSDFNMSINSFDGLACPIKFEPQDMNAVKRHECIKPRFAGCNTTGSWDFYDFELEESCHRRQSPVFDSYLSAKKNVYCLECNRLTSEKQLICDYGGTKGESTIVFTFLLDIAAVLEIDSTIPSVEYTSGCPMHFIKHPYKNECRPVLCPFGFGMTPSGCQLFSKKWFKSAYIVEIELRLEPSESPLPVTAFKTLSFEEISNPFSWLTTHGLPLELFGLIGSTEQKNNQSFIRTIVARFGRNMSPLKVENIFSKISKAIAKKWTMKLDGQTYRLLAGLSKHGFQQHYIKPLKDPLFGQYIEYFQDLIVPVGRLRDVYQFTKMNFCDQVELYEHEFISDSSYLNIQLNLTSNEPGKLLSAGEYLVESNGAKICIEYFQSTYELPSKATSLIQKVVIVAICETVVYSELII